MMHKARSSIEEVPYGFSRSSVKFQGHTAKKNPSILTQIGRFRTVTPIRNHWWLWNDAQSLKQHRCPIVFQGHRSNFKVTRVKKSSILTQIGRFRTVTPIIIHWWLWIDAQSLKQHRCPIVFQGHPSNFKVTQDKKLTILTQIERFRTVTWVLIYQWLSNDTQSLKQHRRGALLFFKIILQISRSHETKNINFDPNWAFPDCYSSKNSLVAMKWYTKLDAI